MSRKSLGNTGFQPNCLLEKSLLQERVEDFFDLVVKVGECAVEDAGGFAGAVEEELYREGRPLRGAVTARVTTR
jgi:hypothetical protein